MSGLCCIRCVVRDTRSVTRAGKLFRTTAFRLSLAYLAIFTLFAGFILGYVAFKAGALLREQNATTIDAEIKGLA